MYKYIRGEHINKFFFFFLFLVVCGWRWSGLRRSEKTQYKFNLGCRLSDQKWLQSLPIHFEFRIVLRIYINHSTMWKNSAHNERSRPMSLQLPRENVKPRVVQQNLVPGAKFFLFMIWLWKSLVLLLVIRAFSWASFHISSNSEICSLLFSPALVRSKLSCLMANRARCSNSTDSWQAFRTWFCKETSPGLS